MTKDERLAIGEEPQMDTSQDLYGFEGAIKRETEKAILFEVQGGGKEIWLPKSQVELEKSGLVMIPKWLVDKHGLSS